MSKRIIAALVFVLALTVCIYAFEPAFAFSGDSWAYRASMTHARAYLGVAAVNGKIYAIGGDEGSETGCCMTGTSMTNNAVNYTEEYDPQANQWTQKASMPTPRALFGTAVYQNKIYCIGGYNGAYVKTGPETYDWKTEYYSLGVNEVYDPATDTWATASSMPTPRNTAATNIVNGKIYVIGGHSMNDLYVTYNLTEAYDPVSNSWATKSPSPLPVSSSASGVVDGKIYVLGDNPKEYWTKSIQIYDPNTDTWEVKGVAPIGYSATAVATTGMNAPKRIYFFDTNRTDIYDPDSNSWSVGTPATINRLIPKAAVLDDVIYLVGGRTGELSHIVLMFPCTLNEQYYPVEYGTPDLSTPTPAPTPTPNPPTTVPNDNLSEPHGQIQSNQQSSNPFPAIPTAVTVGIAFFAVIGPIVFWRKNHP